VSVAVSVGVDVSEGSGVRVVVGVAGTGEDVCVGGARVAVGAGSVSVGGCGVVKVLSAWLDGKAQPATKLKATKAAVSQIPAMPGER
jgi:hypothetical protein